MTLMNMIHLQSETVHGLEEISGPVSTKEGDQGTRDNINRVTAPFVMECSIEFLENFTFLEFDLVKYNHF